MVVEGLAGIGKTSLLTAARRMALQRGLVCYAARGGELERDFAFGIVRRVEGLSLAVIGGTRAPAAGEQMDLIGALTAEEAVKHVAPAPLGEASLATIVRATLGTQTADDVCRACHRATGGNPFLAATLAAALAVEGQPPAEADAGHVAEVAAGAV